jgi:thiol-disulfide isomerase/thioredoxin
MKKIALFLLFLPLLLKAQDQKGRALPVVEVKSLDGKTISTSKFDNDGKPIIISFWATWCKPCINELSNIAEVYDEWVEKTGVKLIAISIDDARNQSKVEPFVNGKNWNYEVYLDPNADFKRAMNVNIVPHTFLLNGNKEIVWQHNSYNDGDEKKLFQRIKAIVEGTPIPTF